MTGDQVVKAVAYVIAAIALGVLFASITTETLLMLGIVIAFVALFAFLFPRVIMPQLDSLSSQLPSFAP